MLVVQGTLATMPVLLPCQACISSGGAETFTHVMQAVSDTLTHKVLREARAQQEELDAEDMPAGAMPQVSAVNIA